MAFNARVLPKYSESQLTARMDWPLYWRLPAKSEVTFEKILDNFLDYIASKDLELYPAQEEAILSLFDNQNLILNTPTGSGKSLVALAMHFHSMAHGKRSFYTCPIKALVNEKFRDLCGVFGPDQVGMMTGDGSVNADAPIICCTAEILSNLALREGELANVQDVVMDEFHYYSDKQRGVAWQVPLLTLKNTRFLLMSATLGEMEFFSEKLTELNGLPTSLVQSTDRPVPLEFEYKETPLHETVAETVGQGLAPIYLVNFSQREAGEEAWNLLSVDFASKEEKKLIAQELIGFQFKSPFGKDVQRLLKHGIGLHHAGLLPKYRILVERLAQKGLLKVISGTDTLGVGVNVPIRTVLFTKLCKYDGEKTAILSSRDFHQISGRAGRRGYDTKGNVMAQAPAHVVENNKMKLKAQLDPKKAKKMVMKTPPTFGFVMWTKETFEKLIRSQPERLISRFEVSHGMLLSVLSRSSNGFVAMKKLIKDSFEDPSRKKKLRTEAFALFRSLYERNIISVGKTAPYKITVNVDLQEDFSLNQTLALYLIDTIELLDPTTPDYALNLLTLVESILESPDLILKKQLDRAKTERMREMKEAGLEYEERMEELDKVEFPKPNRDFIYDTFNAFSAKHPWVGQENIRPKSIAREMIENFHSFADYIKEYELQRVEGLLLRYLSEVYKVLSQTVSPKAQTEEVKEIAVYFENMVKLVDSSLIEDWQRMRGEEVIAKDEATLRPLNKKVEPSKDYIRRIRNLVHSFLRELSKKDFESAADLIQESSEWTKEKIENTMRPFFAEHQGVRIDPAARHPMNTTIKHEGSQIFVSQKIMDYADHNDWMIEFVVPFDNRIEAEGENEKTLTLELQSISQA